MSAWGVRARTIDPAVRDWWPVVLVLVLDQLGIGPTDEVTLPLAVTVAFGLAHGVPLRWRQAHPLAVVTAVALAVMVQAVVISPDLPFGAFVAVMIAAFGVASYSERARAVVGLVIVAALVGITAALQGVDNPAEFIFPIVYIGGAWALGRGARQRRLTAQRLADLAAQLAIERDERIRLALLAERTHISREVHDIVAHSLGVVVVQAEAAASLLPADAPAQRPLEVIQRSGREALDEVRRLLGLLRSEAARQPNPRLDTLPALVDQFREGGLDVELTVGDHAGKALPDDLQMSIFRIVQEALTNAVKHGRATRAAVTVDVSDDVVLVHVVDDGTPSPPTDQHGYGIVGMRERAALFGGDVSTGRCPSGGFVVEARLPIAQP